MSFTIKNAALVDKVFNQVASAAPGVQAYVCAGATPSVSMRATVKTVIPTNGGRTQNVHRFTVPEKLSDESIVYNYVTITIERDPRSTEGSNLAAYTKNYTALASFGTNAVDFAPMP